MGSVVNTMEGPFFGSVVNTTEGPLYGSVRWLTQQRDHSMGRWFTQRGGIGWFDYFYFSHDAGNHMWPQIF